jgi:hypothetical protein
VRQRQRQPPTCQLSSSESPVAGAAPDTPTHEQKGRLGRQVKVCRFTLANAAVCCERSHGETSERNGPVVRAVPERSASGRLVTPLPSNAPPPPVFSCSSVCGQSDPHTEESHSEVGAASPAVAVVVVDVLRMRSSADPRHTILPRRGRLITRWKRHRAARTAWDAWLSMASHSSRRGDGYFTPRLLLLAGRHASVLPVLHSTTSHYYHLVCEQQ